VPLRGTFGVICSCAFPLELGEAELSLCDPVGLSSKASCAQEPDRDVTRCHGIVRCNYRGPESL
jgi:hypothetical protein